ncbi:hypothetical protein HJG60_008953 [Phyllostomus discolor]|uniref:Uncharacterized protein n=1 Tax=Phyllostomus discolor TaxID=89673 RepID=A0A833YWU9_9CHIR|nr:hypothetical protein HJG60_008953 [Phyllostomus discolor]
MFCKSGSIQSESYLFCAEKNVWRDGTFRVYSYLRCSFLFQASCIKQPLFYGPSFNVTIAVKVQYPTLCFPAGNRSADNQGPAGPLWLVPPPPPAPHPAARTTSHRRSAWETLAPARNKGRGSPARGGVWAAGSASPRGRPRSSAPPTLPPSCQPRQGQQQ